jgi:hypothetical protein
MRTPYDQALLTELELAHQLQDPVWCRGLDEEDGTVGILIDYDNVNLIELQEVPIRKLRT